MRARMGRVLEIADIDRETNPFTAVNRRGGIPVERPLDPALDGEVFVDRQHRRPHPKRGRTAVRKHTALRTHPARMLASQLREPPVVPLVIASAQPRRSRQCSTRAYLACDHDPPRQSAYTLPPARHTGCETQAPTQAWPPLPERAAAPPARPNRSAAPERPAPAKPSIQSVCPPTLPSGESATKHSQPTPLPRPCVSQVKLRCPWSPA